MNDIIINGIIEESQEMSGEIKYARGVKGDDGVGISDISKTSTEGNVDTYTIILTDDTTKTFTVTNGISVTTASINSSGHLIVTLNDGTNVDTGMAKGDTGDSGVYIGDTAPTDPSVKVWIDTSGEAGDVEMTSNKTDDVASNAESATKYTSCKGVADYVSAKTKKPSWHNIETVTTTEALSVVTRAFGRANGDIVYPDYTKVNKIQVYLTIPPNADATTSRLECRISDKNNTRIYMWDYVSTTDTKIGWILIERHAKWIPTFTASQTKPASAPISTMLNTYTCSVDNLALTGTENVRYLSFIGQLPAGTVIDIWGYYDED